ncbi:MAG: flippase [Candidatus Shapirobacteria bacterium]
MFQKIKSFLFENKTTRQTIAKNTFWLFFGEISSRVLRAAIVIYAARVLGAEGWGVFSYAITLAAFFTIFSDIGLSAMLTRESSKNPELISKYLSTSFFIKLILMAISIVLMIFIAPIFTKITAAKTLLPIVALILAFDGLREFAFSLNRAIEKMESEALVKILTNVLIVVFGFAFLVYSKSAKSLAFSYVLGSAFGFFMMVWILKPYFKNLVSNFSKNLVWPIFSAAWPFALAGFLGGIMINTDTIMLGWWRTAKEIGFYSVAQRVIQIIYVLPTLLSTSIFPTFARLAQNDNNKFREILQKSIGVVMMVGLPLIFGGIILSKDLILILFGSEYLPSITAFKILLLTIFLIFPGMLIGNALFAYNQQKNFIGFIALGAIGNVILNYLLIPKYGIEGSAIATLVAQILSTGFVWFKMKKVNNFTIFSRLLKVFTATIIMSLFVWVIKIFGINIFINITLSTIVYFGFLYILKEPLINDLRLVFPRSLKNK